MESPNNNATNDENVDTISGSINSLSIDTSNLDTNVKSGVPAQVLKAGNLGKVMNSPRFGVPADKSNDISNMSEFAESAPVDRVEDTRSIEERLSSKKWKDRQSGYRELLNRLQSAKDKSDDPVFKEFEPLMNTCAKDKFAACAVDGLKVCEAFVKNSKAVQEGTFDLEEMLNATIENFGQKSSVVNVATELVMCMLTVKQNKQPIIEAIVQATCHKKVKISSQSVTVLAKAVKCFGVPAIPLGPFQQGIQKMLESSHATTRKEAVKLVKIIYGFTQSLAVFDLSSLKVAMKKEIDDAVAGQPVLKATLNCSQQSPTNDNNVKNPAAPNTKSESADASTVGKKIISEAIFNSMPEVDVTNPIEPFLKLAVSDGEKWSKRKVALEEATKIALGAGRLSGACDYGSFYETIKTAIKDTTLWIRIAGMNLASAFVSCGRSRFTPYAKRLLPELFELFKEKKKVHVTAVNECLDFICMCCISLEDICDMRVFKLCKSNGTNPFVIENALQFVERMLRSGATPREVFSSNTSFQQNLIDTCSFLFSNGKSPEIRNGATKVVMAMVDKIGKDTDATKEMLNVLQMSNKGLHGKVTKSSKKLSNNAKNPSKRNSTDRGGPNRRSSAGTEASLKAKDRGMKNKKPDAGNVKQVVSVDSANLEAPSTMTENEAFEKLESLQLENWDELKEQLKSPKWKEAKQAMQALQDICKASPVEIVTDNGEAIIVLLFSVTKSFKSSNFNLMNAAFDCILTIASACVEHSIQFPIGTAAQFIAPCTSKFGDRKMKEKLHNMLLTVSQCATPKFVIMRVLNAARKLKSPVQIEDILHFFGTCFEDFGHVHCPVKSITVYAAGEHGLEHKTPKIKSKAESLLTDMYKVAGGKVILVIREISNARGKNFADSLEKMDISNTSSVTKKESKRKINVIQTGVIGQHIGGVDGEGDDDVIPTVDITDRVSKALFAQLHCSDGKNSWKKRQDATDTIHNIVKSVKGQVECNKGACRIMRELTKQLRAEKNANTEVRIAACITDLIKKCGPLVSKFTKYVIKDVLLCLSSNNKKLISELVLLLSQWCKHNGEVCTPCVDGIVSFLPSQFNEKGGHLEVAQWMEKFIPFATPGELFNLIPGVFELCRSKSTATRKSAENTLGIIANKAGTTIVLEEFEKLHGVIARTLKPIVDRATNSNQRSDTLKNEVDPEIRNVEARKSTRRGSCTTSTSRARTIPKESRRNSAPSKVLSKLSKSDNGDAPKDSNDAPILKVVPMKKKAQRAKEASRRPWVLPDRPEAPANDLVERMRINLEQVSCPKFFSYLFSSSASQKLKHIGKACDMLKDFVVDLENREAVFCNLDLIFKWATLHLDLKQATALKPLQAMLLALFSMLKEEQYVLTEYEVSVILPCLVLHVGNKIERLADNYITMIRIISSLHEPAKVAQYLLYGIDARAIRNSKSRKLNLGEVARLIVKEGWQVVGTKGLRSIASEIDSQTEAIRQGALVAIVAAWEKIDRDSEKILKCIGRSLSSKGETLLKQRLEAVSGEAIPDFSKDNKQNLQNNNKSKKTVDKAKIKANAKSRSKASTENLFAEIDAMTTSLRSPPKSTINANSLVDNNGTNKDYCKDDEFAFEFQEISDKELNLVVSQIENLEIEESLTTDSNNLAVSIAKKDSISSSDDLGSPLFDHARKKHGDIAGDSDGKSVAATSLQIVTQIVASIDEWQSREVKNETGEFRICFDSLKKLTDIFAPNDSVKNADAGVLTEIVTANLVPSVVDRVCSVINFWIKDEDNLSSIYPTRALTVLVKMMEHKDFVKSIGVQSLKLLIGVTVQSLVDARLEVASLDACNIIANNTVKYCNRSHVFQALALLAADFPKDPRCRSLVVKMFSKTIRMEASKPYSSGRKPYENIEDLKVYTKMHAAFEKDPSLCSCKEVVDIFKLVVANIVEHCGFPTNFSDKCSIPLESVTGMFIKALDPKKNIEIKNDNDSKVNEVRDTNPTEPVKSDGDSASNFDVVLKKIFDKIKSKESQTGVKELFIFKRHHPDVDTEPFMKESSAAFQTFIRNQLKRLEDAEQASASSVDAKVSGGDDSKSNIRRSRGSSQSLLAMKARLAALRGNLTSDGTTKTVPIRSSVDGSSLPKPSTVVPEETRRNSTDPKRTSTGTALDFRARLKALREKK